MKNFQLFFFCFLFFRWTDNNFINWKVAHICCLLICDYNSVNFKNKKKSQQSRLNSQVNFSILPQNKKAVHCLIEFHTMNSQKTVNIFTKVSQYVQLLMPLCFSSIVIKFLCYNWDYFCWCKCACLADVPKKRSKYRGKSAVSTHKVISNSEHTLMPLRAFVD